MKTQIFHNYSNTAKKLSNRVLFHNLVGGAVMAGEDLYQTTTDSNQVGFYIENGGGNGFRYVKAGASDLVVGNVIQSPAVDAQFTNMAVPAAVAAGTTGNITVTNGTTTVVAGDFAGGSLSVYTTPGLGEEYTIIANGAATSGAALTVVLDRPIRTAWTTATKVNMRLNQYNGVIQAPITTLTGTVVGIAVYAIKAGQYGWIQSNGVTAALSDSTSILVGSAISGMSTIAAGSVTLASAGISPIGYAMQAGASTHCIAVRLQID